MERSDLLPGSTGGGTVNALRDRDTIGFSLAYTF